MAKRRGGRRKVTREIADFIRTKHEEGYVHRQIKRLVDEKYAIDLHPVTITRYYKPWDEIIEKYKMMARKQKRERYDRVYHRYYRHLDKYLSELFSAVDTLSLEEISSGLKKISGIEFKTGTLERKIESYRESGKICVDEIAPRLYKRK